MIIPLIPDEDEDNSGSRPRWPWWVVLAVVLLILLVGYLVARLS